MASGSAESGGGREARPDEDMEDLEEIEAAIEAGRLAESEPGMEEDEVDSGPACQGEAMAGQQEVVLIVEEAPLDTSPSCQQLEDEVEELELAESLHQLKQDQAQIASAREETSQGRDAVQTETEEVKTVTATEVILSVDGADCDDDSKNDDNNNSNNNKNKNNNDPENENETDVEGRKVSKHDKDLEEEVEELEILEGGGHLAVLVPAASMSATGSGVDRQESKGSRKSLRTSNDTPSSHSATHSISNSPSTRSKGTKSLHFADEDELAVEMESILRQVAAEAKSPNGPAAQGGSQRKRPSSKVQPIDADEDRPPPDRRPKKRGLSFHEEAEDSDESEVWEGGDKPEDIDADSLRLLASGDRGVRCSWLAYNDPDSKSGLVRVAIDDLQEAALRGDLETAYRLVQAGASVNAPIRPQCESEFMCLLHVLASKPELPRGKTIMTQVIRWRANLNVRSSLGSTPLSRACVLKNVAAVEVLLAAGADPYAVDDAGRRAPACAVLLRKDRLRSVEVKSSLEVVKLLSQYNVDLNDGGDIPPIILAIQQSSTELVEALLEHGAQADGLGVAVAFADLPLIRQLVLAFANPFVKDEQGRTVMDRALARGDEAITSLIRDYIGDLQRMRHPHMAVLEEQMKQDAEADALALLVQSSPLRKSKNKRKSFYEEVTTHRCRCCPTWVAVRWFDSGLQRHVDRLQHICRRINKNNGFQSAMFSCLLLALFLPDTWVLMNVPTNDALDTFLILMVVMFLFELLVQTIGLWQTYVFSFFFWMDLVGVLSVPLDHSLVVNSLPTSLDNTVVMRAARMAKLGARAGRFTKIVKMLRFLPGMKDVGNDGTAKVISGFLNRALSMRVSCLIIVMVMTLPLFELVSFPENDFSLKFWTEEISDRKSIAANELDSLYDQMEEFFQSTSYYPYQVESQTSGVWNTTMLSQNPPLRTQNSVVVHSGSGDVKVYFNFQSPNQVDALANIVLIGIIIVLMVVSALILSASVSSIVMKPLEQLFDNVQHVASKIFNSVTNLTGKSRDDDNDDEEEDEQDEENVDPMGAETKLLEKVLQKIAVLSEITMKASPLDADQLQQLDDSDRALLEGYGGAANPAEEAGYEARRSKRHTVHGLELEKAAMLALTDVGLSKEALDMWDLNVAELSETARHRLCLSTLLVAQSSRSGDFAERADNFLTGAHACYRQTASNKEGEKPGLYHNWVHAVDVTFTLSHLIRACGAKHYLAFNERFAVFVAAICHDMGHWGFNNSYLVEMRNELAMQYSDISPLQNMSAARVFELAKQEGSQIFADLEKVQYRLVRKVIVESILHTDFRHHNSMVKEINNLYEMNIDLFHAAEDSYNEEVQAFPAKEVVDFFRGDEVKKQLRVSMLHLADISNPMKPWPLAELWAALLTEEMLHQGDVEKERGLPVGPLNDRDRINRSYAQVGFIEFFVAPFLMGLSCMVPPLDSLAVEPMIDNLDSWFKRWRDESMPPEEELKRVAERISAVTARGLQRNLGKPIDVTDYMTIANSDMGRPPQGRSNRTLFKG